MNQEIISQSIHDLYEDFEELSYLFSSTYKQIQTFQKDIEKQEKHIDSYLTITQQIKVFDQVYKNIQKDLQLSLSPSLPLLLNKKRKYYDLYRSLQSIIAGLITTTDWQSPTFHHSLYPLSGRQTGKIIANYNDYKRDQHSDAKIYAERFRNTYIDTFFKFTIPIYVTNSGMAALTTIINYLKMNKKIAGPLLLGSSSYFQNKELIKGLFTDVYEIHEHETKKIQDFIQKKQPSIIFLDSLCNSHDIALPNIKEVIKTLQKYANKDVYLVIDNTCLGPSFQPLQLLGKIPKNIHMIVFESLNKYHQFGIDKTMGGIIYTYGRDMNKLFFAIQHSGTILPDFSCFLLPSPNRKILLKRLIRHQRNAIIIVEKLQSFIQTHQFLPLQSVIYPNQNTHPAYSWSKNLSFYGSYFTFQWKKENIALYKRFISAVLKEAKKQQIQLVQGTSFGMNTSRIYLTATNTKFGKPFIRFSVGTESRAEIEAIVNVLIKSVEKL